MDEQVAPFTAEGFILDSRKKRVYDRRMTVMRLVIDGYRPSDIAMHTNMSRQKVSDDVVWLRKNHYINPDFSMRRKFKPTREMLILIAEMLRGNWTYKRIASEMNVSSTTISNFVAKTKDKGIREAHAYKVNLNKPKPKKPLVGRLNAKEFTEFFGLDPETWSDCNILVSWSDYPFDELPMSVKQKMWRMQKTDFSPPKVYLDYWENQKS